MQMFYSTFDYEGEKALVLTHAWTSVENGEKGV